MRLCGQFSCFSTSHPCVYKHHQKHPFLASDFICYSTFQTVRLENEAPLMYIIAGPKTSPFIGSNYKSQHVTTRNPWCEAFSIIFMACTFLAFLFLQPIFPWGTSSPGYLLLHSAPETDLIGIFAEDVSSQDCTTTTSGGVQFTTN